MKYAIESGAHTYTVELALVESSPGEIAVSAQVDGRAYTLQFFPVEPDVYWFRDEGRSREAVIDAGGDEMVTVEVGPRRFRLRVLDRRERLERGRSAGTQGTGQVDLRAPMHGKVVRVLVEDGVEVKDGQAVAVIEAMKMQNEMKAPKAGTVRVHVAPGQTVNAGQVVFSVV